MTIEQVRCNIGQQLAETHATAIAALDHDQVGRFDAVVWLSAHLMAAERALHPAVRRHLPTSAAVLDEHRRADRRLHRALRALEQVSAGDTLAADLDERVVRQQVTQHLDAHIAAEREFVDLLSASLSEGEDCELAERYWRLLTHGVTRPHPHAPSHGPLAGLVFRIDRVRDHVLDVLDSRTTPLPRHVAPHVAPGQWGLYILGSMQDTRADGQLEVGRDPTS
jgi:hypothetical protein